VIISSLRTTAFRNLTDSLVKTSAKTIFLVGKNGQGKTNFLESLYFCAYASSFRKSRDSEIVQTGKKDFSVSITIKENLFLQDDYSEILVKFEKNEKIVFINEKKIKNRKELLYVIPCIIFCHEDMEFIKGSPEQRRWFFDQVLSLYDSVYLEDLRCYRMAIRSRNIILRDNLKLKLESSPESLLDALDSQCAFYGLRLMQKRHMAAQLFSDVFTSLYSEVSGILGMTVKYISSWKSFNEKEIVDALANRRQIDMTMGISMTGPHRDRYSFAIGNSDFVANASTGQRRLLALLLRVAQAIRFSEATGRKPILLLDDVLLEMDGEKRQRFISVLPEYDQAFFTFLPEESFYKYKKEDTLIYNVEKGQIKA